ncbi:MFS transporter [Actinacidiphila yeochonensis]|uniref:MFS transporter n=1 Tax=Actinacidiphila yeochonensis TaxID=89050 RepID=UPI0006925C19|nr:MFS transporter [Actinacidiphila yeochonensis]
MRPSHRSALPRNRDFSLLLGGRLVSAVGDQAQSMALPLLVLTLTGSAARAGIVLGLGTTAFLVSGPVAGALADRWERRAAMIWCDVGRAALTGGVAVAGLLHRLAMPQLYATAVAAGVLSTLFEAAGTAALPQVVGPRQLPAALGLQQSAAGAAGVFGAPLAGVLYSAGRAVPFAVNAASFAVSALSLSLVRTRFQQERPATPARLADEVRQGLGWLRRQPVVRFLALVSAADKVRYGAGYLLIITLARRLGASPFQVGAVFGGAALGAMAGALASGRIARRFPLGRIAVATLWLEALMFPLYALAPDPPALAAVAAAESLLVPVYTVAMTTHQLAVTPDELRGRATAAVSALTTGALSMGTLAGGALITALGPTTLVWVCGAWLLALALATTANRAVRQAPPAGALPHQRPAAGEGEAVEPAEEVK